MASAEDSSNVQKSNKKFQCSYDGCQKYFTTLQHLNRHKEAIHINKVYRCEICEEIFKSQYAVKRHTDNKHLKLAPKKYQCDYCDEDFNKKSWLNQHIYKHTGIKPYKCTHDNCEARFVVPSKLRRHMLMHEGYKCPKEDCDKKFPKWTDVRKHMVLVHPKEYRCPECDQVFTRSNNLKSHLEVHNSNRLLFTCPKEGCHRFYSKKSNLMQHIINYHDKRPFHCSVGKCFRSFSAQEDLDVHVSKHITSKKFKKKKKKKRPKPSFAEHLAGLVPKKWQVDLLENASETVIAKPSLEIVSDLSSREEDNESELESVTKCLETVLSDMDEEKCDKIPILISNEDLNNNDPNLSIISDTESHVSNEDIQTLLNIIESRKDFEAETTSQRTKSVAVKA